MIRDIELNQWHEWADALLKGLESGAPNGDGGVNVPPSTLTLQQVINYIDSLGLLNNYDRLDLENWIIYHFEHRKPKLFGQFINFGLGMQWIPLVSVAWGEVNTNEGAQATQNEWKIPRGGMYRFKWNCRGASTTAPPAVALKYRDDFNDSYTELQTIDSVYLLANTGFQITERFFNVPENALFKIEYLSGQCSQNETFFEVEFISDIIIDAPMQSVLGTGLTNDEGIGLGGGTGTSVSD